MCMPYPRKVPRKPPEGHVTVEQAAEILDMAVPSFYRYRRQYEADFPKPLMEGGRAWYSRAELEAWRDKYMSVDPQ